ncbi:type IV pilin N-terminal domain-containing protein [Methanoregula sp.]|uniref:type IV pilin N-terminal domain-containing protein n=1 Tax=Methanoregula sp. TaxID=2052170 RepID=UPI002D7FF800|nr:type IV pilin N-terminal domain-containing protein [Methanoregula sp.]
MQYRKNNEAISEVVSTILLVAITVILAAVIVAFVMGMTGNIQKGKIATSTINRVNGSFVTVTFAGGQNAGSVVGINWTVNGGAPATWIGGSSVTAGIQNRPASGGILSIGANALLAAPDPGKDRVLGIAVFTDGSQQVILDKTL